jgi:hypothetical protein
MPERWPSGNNGNEVPPPYYEGDKGWSKEREKREDEITKVLDQVISFKTMEKVPEETLNALRSLIDETEDAIRKDPETHAGVTWLEQSRFVQGLLYDWYRATKDRSIE